MLERGFATFASKTHNVKPGMRPAEKDELAALIERYKAVVKKPLRLLQMDLPLKTVQALVKLARHGLAEV